MVNFEKVLPMLSLVVLLTLAMLPLNTVKVQDETLFSVTIIAPGNANMMRRQWAHMLADSLKELRINASVVYLGWAEVFNRVFTPPEENVGKPYAEGGFDIQLVGWTPELIPEPSQLYYGSEESFAPTGNNYYLFNNTEANGLMDIFLTTTNTTERDEASKELQTIFYNELPASQIFYSSTPTAVTPELGGPALGASPGGEGWLYFNAQPNPEMLTGKTEVVYASTGEIESLIPPLSNSWYDTIISANVFGGLVLVKPSLSSYTDPNLLTNWVASENGFKWTWTCRTGVKWHDGEDFTADDVVFSIWALMNPATGTQHQGTYTQAFGDNVKFTYADSSSTTLGTGTRVGNITAVDATTVEMWLPELLPGKPYGFFDPYLLGFANNIIPKHIFGEMAPADWTDSPFNTGDGSITIGGTTYTGPVGTGPYKWVDFNPVAQLAHLEKFTGYWNASALEADGLFGVEDYYIRFIADKTPALAALKNDEVDILDPQYQIQVDIPTIDPSWGKVLLNEGTGRQEVGYNHQHPVLGTGVDTPLGQSDPTRAAEAAKYVRLAFDYAIPRQLIIDNLLVGFGTRGTTYFLPIQPYYNSSITSRPFDLSKAKEYLRKAGYTVSDSRTTHEFKSKAWVNDGTVYIRANGSVDPPTAPIQRDGYLYTLTDNLYDSIVVERDDIVVDGAGYTVSVWGTGIDLSDRSNVTIKNMEIIASYYSIYLSGSLNNNISGNNVTSYYVGVGLCDSSKSNSISGNNITNTYFGIELYHESNYNNISGNNLIDNYFGIWFYESSNNSVSGNNITANEYHGIVLKYHSNYNSISENSVAASNYFGIEIYWFSNYNAIFGNEITNNGCGIYAVDSSNNIIYHNNFFNNTSQVYISNSIDVWDNDYPSGGNYWSDYAGADSYWGPSQNKTGGDGIGDTPYTIDDNNQDHYPLVSPYEYWSNPIPGDINKDMKVDHKDLLILAAAYGSSSDWSNWNPNADLNNDGVVGHKDLLILASNYGKEA